MLARQAGLARCFGKVHPIDELDLAKLLASVQRDAFRSLGLDFAFFAGKRLTLKNVEHCLCEFEKYRNNGAGMRRYASRAPRRGQPDDGRGGFMNVCVGSTAFAFALYKHQKEHFEQLEDEREARFHKEYDLTLDRINATKPETLLDALSWTSLGVRGIPDAARADENRAQLKRMWTSVRRLYAKYPNIAPRRDEIKVDLGDGVAR
ncbi:hypothetical protein JL721_11009 [Aureococcus anophagefferens]|nr:hypothetical protein JL721_11009 [Aureococcus anophagefferens]